MIYPVLDLYISLESLGTSEHHNTRWRINLSLRLPELPCFTIISRTIESKGTFIDDILVSVWIIERISDKFMDFDTCIFSLDRDGIELTCEKKW